MNTIHFIKAHHKYDDSSINVDNIEEEVDVIYIHYTNETNIIFIKYGVNLLHKYYMTFLLSNTQEGNIFLISKPPILSS